MNEASPREGKWAETQKAIGMGLPKPLGAYVLSSYATDARYGTTRLNVYLARF